VKDLWVILGDATQLHQVFMNLCVNARDAMPNGGALTIRGQNVSLDENYTRMGQAGRPGPYIVIEVADTGCGIPPEIKEKIFEPFFTTKEIGKGTGLGLSTVSAIVKSHNGFVDVYSEPGRGSSFKLYLPAAPSQRPQAVSDMRAQAPLGNGELILVVDDEAAVREITQVTLKNHGYAVLTANDGAEGIAVFAKHMKDIRLVISDMDMPILNGDAMIRSLEAIKPGVRVISASGLPRHEWVAGQPSISPYRTFLSKPFTAEQLLIAVHDTLHSA
jgi:CheY-like chemotaxis protein